MTKVRVKRGDFAKGIQTFAETFVDFITIEGEIVEEDTPKPVEERCDCGEEICLGGAEVEIGGICHRLNRPCYIIGRHTSPSEEKFETCPHGIASIPIAYCSVCGKYPKPSPSVAVPLPEEIEKYYELIMAVGKKYEGETRHETALRYIRNAEHGSDRVAKTNHPLPAE